MNDKLRISEILKSRGMTQTDLADKIGISRVGLSKAINGNTTITTLSKIAAALGVTVPELFAQAATNTIACPHCGAVLEIKEKE